MSGVPLPLAVFAADTQGRVRFRVPLVTYTNAFEDGANTLWMSPQVEAVTGYRADEWVGNEGFFVNTAVHPADRDAVLEEMRQSRANLAPFSRDYRLRSRDGRDIWIHDESVPVLDACGKPEFIHGYFVDITERKRMENALAHAQRTEAVGRLAAGIAHDFNNLLTAIAGYAEIAQRGLDADHPSRRPIGEITQVVRRAVRLTRQLLAFSRRQELRPEVVDLSDLVHELESMLLHIAGGGIQVDFQLCGPALVSADIGQLEQVLMNLVANARDAMPSGGRVSIRTELVEIVRGVESDRLRVRPGTYAALSVADTGVGIEPETVAHVFDPFFTTKARGAGTGLGLSTVQGVVRQSGGAVDVSSTPGHGATFRILLPVVQSG